MHPHTIFVTSLFEMPHYVSVLRPSRLISIIQPELQPDRPPELTEADHLRVGVHDIVERQRGGILIDEQDVAELVDFIRAWQPQDGALLVHCYAGVSRSTASAFIAACIKTEDPRACAKALRAAAPHAIPNRRIIALADSILGSGGDLIAACDAMGEPTVPVVEAPLTTLRLHRQE